MIIEKLKQRLMNRLKVDEATGCWNWTGPQIGKGYGMIRVPWTRTPGYVHRVAWMIENGEIPKGMQVCHKCDNRICARPDHLFLGTCGDNLQDMRGKGRHLYGERNTEAKLTEEQVLQIHALSKTGLSQKKIAAKFGVGQMTVCRILRGERWNHIFLRLTASD